MLLVVGQIARPHGIRGEVVVDLRTDEPERRYAAGSVLVTDPAAASGPQPAKARPDPAAATGRPEPPVPSDGRWRPPATLTVAVARPHLGRMIVEFEGIDDRNLAEALRGVLLWVDSSQVPPSDDPDEFNDHQLVGLAAVDVTGEHLGEVLRVEHAPASDLLVLRLADGRTGLVPFVKAIVPEVDLVGGRVVLTPPEGLFDL